MSEEIRRSIVKAIVWRVIGIILMFCTSYAFLKDVSISVEITIVNNILATIFYYFHERIWSKIDWGNE